MWSRALQEQHEYRLARPWLLGDGQLGRAGRYCLGHSTVAPSFLAATGGQYGFRRNSRASSTASAWPVARIYSACLRPVTMPTAPVPIPASLRITADSGVG
jgi:hypothetical protein